MNATERIHGSRRALALFAALGAGWLLGGCVYRPDIQQGNLLQVREVEQVKPGMTRSQVRYLLGTPMVSDPFEPNRWDYVYTFRRGRDTRIDRSHFVVHFDGDKVARVEKLDLPEETAQSKILSQQREAKAAAQPAAPAAPAAAPPEVPAAPSGTELPTDAPKPQAPPPGGG
jgi:outer membrane protein assembly factor BamE